MEDTLEDERQMKEMIRRLGEKMIEDEIRKKSLEDETLRQEKEREEEEESMKKKAEEDKEQREGDGEVEEEEAESKSEAKARRGKKSKKQKKSKEEDLKEIETNEDPTRKTTVRLASATTPTIRMRKPTKESGSTLPLSAKPSELELSINLDELDTLAVGGTQRSDISRASSAGSRGVDSPDLEGSTGYVGYQIMRTGHRPYYRECRYRAVFPNTVLGCVHRWNF
jgi:hypothetical protein